MEWRWLDDRRTLPEQGEEPTSAQVVTEENGGQIPRTQDAMLLSFVQALPRVNEQ